MSTPEPLAAARTAALSEDRAREALGALGGTPYRLAELEYAVADGVFLAVGALKDLRRRAVAALGERRVAARRRSAGRVRGRRPRAAPPGAPARRPRLRRRPSSCACARASGRSRSRAAAPTAWTCSRATRPRRSPAPSTTLRALGSPVRVRLPEVLFDADAAWLAGVLALAVGRRRRPQPRHAGRACAPASSSSTRCRA